MENDLCAIDDEYGCKGWSQTAAGLAKMAYARELQDMKRRSGEESLESYSHGESFLTLFEIFY